MKCVQGHDRCHLGPSDNCPYCEPEDKPPTMRKQGRILFERNTLGDGIGTGIEWIVYDFDEDTSVFWINEEEGFDFWLERQTDIEHDGNYVIEGVYGTVHKDFEGETDVEWNWRLCRRASDEEVETGNLDLKSPTYKIEITFPEAVDVDDKEFQDLVEVVCRICARHGERNPHRVMWPFGIGGKMLTSPFMADKDHPMQIDMECLVIECAERENYDALCAVCNMKQGDHMGCAYPAPAGACTFKPRRV